MSLISLFDPWRSVLCTCPKKLSFNPYTGCDHGCVYCYASSYVPRFSSCRPKKDLEARLEKEAGRLRGELVCISSSSDPYPNVEAEKGLTRRCLKILSSQVCKIQLVTKSPLVVRDVDLLTVIPSMVCLTITTENDELAELIEPGAESSSARLKAVQALVEKGVPVSVRVDPIIPFVNDDVESLIRLLGELGVKHVTCSTLKLKPDSWKRLSGRLPDVSKRLRPLYFENPVRKAGGYYLPEAVRIRLMENVGRLVRNCGMRFGTCREGLSYLNSATCDGSWLLKESSV